MIKAIETRWKGYRFRSRLEARWAVFFDACGYQWEYEPEGYELEGGIRYLPDFKIFGEDSNGDYNVFLCEVKPSGKKLTSQEQAKITAFQKAVEEDVYSGGRKLICGYGDFIILEGAPSERFYEGTLCYSGYTTMQWVMEPVYRQGRPCFDQYSDNLSQEENYRRTMRTYGVIGACGPTPIEISRSARFEHGEKPRVLS